MADPRFFSNAGPLTIGALVEVTGASAPVDADMTRKLSDVQPLQTADDDHLSFIDNKKYLPAFEVTRAGAVLAHPSVTDRAPEHVTVLTSPDPYRAYAMAASAFYPTPAPTPGISSGAHVATSALIDASAAVAPGAVIGERVEIGARTRIGPGAVIGDGVIIEEDCSIGPNATLVHCLIGARSILHAGVRIGQDGFGFAPGGPPQGHLKVPQLGRVIIGHDVEIGANTTIDRGTGPDTEVGAGTKIDNLVQLAHNVKLGKGCIIVSQVGISGSTEVGDFVMIGGQAGLTGHLSIGMGAKIAAQSGVMKDVPPGATMGGSPAKPSREWLKETAVLTRLAKKKDV